MIKRAGSKKGKQGGKSSEIVKRACSFIRYLRVESLERFLLLLMHTANPAMATKTRRSAKINGTIT